MTTVVNNPTPAATDSGGSNFVIGAVLVVGFFVIFMYFGIPVLQRMRPVQLTIPTPQVVMPDKIDVNVSQTE